MYRIEAADPYPDGYDATVARNVREQDDEARPAIAGPLDSIEAYDTVLLGSPIWNVRPPMIMNTFADRYDFRGKTVHPFVTYAVSGLGSTERVYAAACPGATIAPGWRCRGRRWLRTATGSRRGCGRPGCSPDRSAVEAAGDLDHRGGPRRSSLMGLWLAVRRVRRRTP